MNNGSYAPSRSLVGTGACILALSTAMLVVSVTTAMAAAGGALPHQRSGVWRDGGERASTTTTSTEPPSPWRGHDKTCVVRLPGTGPYRLYQDFWTCPPKRVLVVGDSVALTMGIEMAIDEQNWGTLLENESMLGCGFVTGYELNADGKPVPMNAACSSELEIWQKDAISFKPQAIVVEMGWWDSQIHYINGAAVNILQAGYQRLVLSRMLAFLSGLATVTRAPIYLLTVPWMAPFKWPNGQEDPAASAPYHDEINALLARAVAERPNSYLFDVSPALTPSGHYQEYADGGRCRETDGVHLYTEPFPGTLDFVSTPCGRALQKGLLSTVRQKLAG